ncbi:MAG: hypothetical protein ACXIUV_04995 [Alkalilacustris sp.]
MTSPAHPALPGPGGVGRREVLALAAAAAVLRPPERVVISAQGWVLLESDLR